VNDPDERIVACTRIVVRLQGQYISGRYFRECSLDPMYHEDYAIIEIMIKKNYDKERLTLKFNDTALKISPSDDNRKQFYDKRLAMYVKINI
jgi:hypothetical protein